jgi:DNA phosphorothioation system restriction enzyme
MSSFKDLNVKLSLNTTEDDIINDFFIPVLERSVSYDVAVGFFTSAWMRDAAAGIARFACNDGKARFIISPILSENDYQLLKDAREDQFEHHLYKLSQKSFQDLFDDLQSDVRTAISWMIHDNILNFKIGIPKNVLSGMMHAKLGVFTDHLGNRISFNGSYNFTSAAATNWEDLQISCDWKSEESKQRSDINSGRFNKAWEGKDNNLETFNPSERDLSPFIQEYNNTQRPYNIIKNRVMPPLKIPTKYLVDGKPRDYQLEAIEAWIRNRAKGILCMATGSGKTVTALSIATNLANKARQSNGRLNILIVITVPYKHLAIQWMQEAETFGFKPLLCFSGMGDWEEGVLQAFNNLNSGASSYEVLITVNNTFASEKIQPLLLRRRGDILLIADEMHNLGSKHYLNNLPESINLRLGLSATPMRHRDDVGTKGLSDYFGPVVFTFTLKDAIERGFLCHYFYYPILCPLNDEEMSEYKELSVKIGKAYALNADGNVEDDDRLRNLLVARARLVSRIGSKISNLIDLLKNRRDSHYNLVYCGDASSSDGEDQKRQISKVMELLGKNLGMKVKKITQDENPLTRHEILDDFSKGIIQVIVAIKCLDEGVDVPRTENAYILASSTNPRQYIQRRGRVLRTSPGKKYAYIYDFIAVPDLEQIGALDEEAFKVERNLLKREFERINEFSGLAENEGEVRDTLRALSRAFQLTGA